MRGDIFLLVFFGAIGISIGIYYLLKYLDKIKKSKLSVVTEEEKEDFVEIETFNEDRYVENTIKRVLHSVQIDDWGKTIQHDEISFQRKPEGASSWQTVKLIVKYEIKHKKFEIKHIHLNAGDFFTYKGDIDSGDYKFFYDCYANWKKQKNRENKERTDESLKRIHSIIGKSSIRDSKLDELLGGED